MPELPEVESIRLSLLPRVTGRTIGTVLADTPGVLVDTDSSSLSGLTISGIRRRGKYLVFDLGQSGDGPVTAFLMVHLRMTGRLTLQPQSQPVRPHTHVRLELLSGCLEPVWLIFQDTRRFGRIWLIPAPDGAQWPGHLARLGPEPLDPAFNAQVLKQQMARHARLSVKAALLDQTIIAGLGNIYADESLFRAGLYPARKVAGLQINEYTRLAHAITQVLAEAIACCGTTLRDYVDGWSREGQFQNFLNVYGQAGKPCRRCTSLISKGKLAGRTTSWCPVCQPDPDAYDGTVQEQPSSVSVQAQSPANSHQGRG